MWPSGVWLGAEVGVVDWWVLVKRECRSACDPLLPQPRVCLLLSTCYPSWPLSGLKGWITYMILEVQKRTHVLNFLNNIKSSPEVLPTRSCPSWVLLRQVPWGFHEPWWLPVPLALLLLLMTSLLPWEGPCDDDLAPIRNRNPNPPFLQPILKGWNNSSFNPQCLKLPALLLRLAVLIGCLWGTLKTDAWLSLPASLI